MDLTITRTYFSRKSLSGKHHVFCRVEISPNIVVVDMRKCDTKEEAESWVEKLNSRTQPEKVEI